MLTIDDCNTILKKYGGQGYWRQIDLADIPLDEGAIYQFEDVGLLVDPITSIPHLTINIPFNGGIYLTNHDGDILDILPYLISSHNYMYYLSDLSNDMIFNIYINTQQIDSTQYFYKTYAFIPVSPLQILVTNDGFDEKFYITPLRDNLTFTIDNVAVQLESDEHGTYVTLPSAETCYVGACASSTRRYIPFEVSFREFKELPIPYIPTLYKGTPQSIQVLNSEDDDPISDYQTYYQGRLLKDNTIQLPYDSEDYVDIIVDLKDYRYPFCRVKLKAPTTLYTATSQAEVETAIEQGIKTIQVIDNNSAVELTNIELTDVLFIDSKITIDESTLTNVSIIDTTYTDNGDNSLTDCTIKTSTITSTGNPSTYADCKILECDITGMELHLTGAITDSTLTNTLIISDGIIEVIDNTFTGKYSKDYFPSFLYLTGDYLAKNNTFTLNDEWEEPAFNMCVIKSIETFNPIVFLNENIFHLNIEYGTEEPDTFYYNIVDDDKIKAKRLS